MRGTFRILGNCGPQKELRIIEIAVCEDVAGWKDSGLTKLYSYVNIMPCDISHGIIFYAGKNQEADFSA